MLASKIFHVLMKWIQMHTEVHRHCSVCMYIFNLLSLSLFVKDFKDPELTRLLEGFLQKTIDSDTVESQLASDTLE